MLQGIVCKAIKSRIRESGNGDEKCVKEPFQVAEIMNKPDGEQQETKEFKKKGIPNDSLNITGDIIVTGFSCGICKRLQFTEAGPIFSKAYG